MRGVGSVYLRGNFERRPSQSAREGEKAKMKAELKIPTGYYRLRNGTPRKKSDLDLAWDLRDGTKLVWRRWGSAVGYVTKYCIVIRRKAKA